MRELGKYSTAYHKELASHIINTKIDKVFLSGTEVKTTYEELLKLGFKEVKYSEDKLDFLEDLKALSKKKVSFLFKASRTLNFEELFFKLEEKK